MGIWILIMSITGVHSVSMESVEFSSKEKCEIAQEKAIDNLDRFSTEVKAICVEK